MVSVACLVCGDVTSPLKEQNVLIVLQGRIQVMLVLRIAMHVFLDGQREVAVL